MATDGLACVGGDAPYTSCLQHCSAPDIAVACVRGFFQHERALPMSTRTSTIDLDASFDPRELRNALGRFATGIAVVMAGDDEGLMGVTVNSFSAVSLDPPLILFCMARTLNSLARLEQVKAYSVNILLESQQELSNRFARAGEDKFAGTDWHPGRSGAPRLTAAHATFECVPYAHYDGGDHIIFVGRVVHMHAEGDDAPLLYYRGRYRLLAEPEA